MPINQYSYRPLYASATGFEICENAMKGYTCTMAAASALVVLSNLHLHLTAPSSFARYVSGIATQPVLHTTNNTTTSSMTSIDSSCVPPLPLRWEWNFYSKDNSTRGDMSSLGNFSKRKNTLIAMFAGFDKYASMLEETAPINKAYAKRWKQDLVVLQGTSYILPVDGNCTPPGRRTTLNKISLLRLALQKRKKYDQILILDTDAMMYGFDADVSALLPEEYMLAAHRVSEKPDENHTFNVNAGVLLWNLKHPLTRSVAREWHERSVKLIEKKEIGGDQRPLQKVLRTPIERAEHVVALLDEFAYSRGTIVKHFIREPDHKTWNDPNLVNVRHAKIQNATREVCERHYGSMDECLGGIEKVKYSNF